MENNTKTNLSYILRGLIAVLFLFSAFAKLYPSPNFAIPTFEKDHLWPLGFSQDMAYFFSRTLIGVEFALGFLILQPHFLKKIIVPATIGLLVVFIIQLAYEVIKGNGGNCGCFGELLKMTPLEAIIKNVIAVALLVWLLILLRGTPEKTNVWVLVGVTAVCIATIYIISPGMSKTDIPVVVYGEGEGDSLVNEPQDAPVQDSNNPAQPAQPSTEVPATTTPDETPKPVAEQGPKAVTSPYSKYFPKADQGKKIIAFFAPGCEHCQETAKELTAMKAKDKDFPDMYIIFMDEDAERIPEFFTIAGRKYPYTVLDVGTFWKVLGMQNDTPGVIYQYNGNKVKEWQGINDKKFNAAELKAALKK